MNRKKYIVLSLMAVLFMNCINNEIRNIQNLKKLEVDFQTIKIKNVESQGLLSLNPKLGIDTEIEIRNPNKTPVTIYTFTFNVFLLDKEFKEKELLGNIYSEEEYEIPAESLIVIPVKVKSEFEERITDKLFRLAIKILSDLNNNRETVFEINGNLHYKTLLGNISIPVHEIQKAKLR